MKNKKPKEIGKKNDRVNAVLNKKSDFRVYELILFAVLIIIVSVF